MRSKLFFVTVAAGLLAACAAPDTAFRSARTPMTEDIHTQRMLVPERPPVIAAVLAEDIVLARMLAERVDPARMYRDPLSQWTAVDALPFLTSTELGRRFLSAARPRALARGTPEEACPALAMASGAAAEGAAGRAEVAAQALTNCIGQLPKDGAICGCRVVAIDDVVTVPREQTSYATGTTARLRSKELDLDLLLVAEDGDDGETLLRDLAGPVVWLKRGEAQDVTLRLADSDRVFTGTSIPVGFRRGRLAERIYAVDKDGARISLLIGFGPDELAQTAGAWLAWPHGG